MRQYSPAPRPARRGRAALLALALIAALLLAAAWFFAPRAATDRTEPSEPAPQARALGAAATLSGETALAEVAAPLSRPLDAVDAGVRLRGPGRLEGTVLARETGTPVPGVAVRLLALPPSAATILTRVTDMVGMGAELRRKVLPVAVTETDQRGRFAFIGVREGRWHVDVSAAHHVSDTAETVRVVASGSGGPVELWTRAGGRVLGEVVLPDGRPASGALVMLSTGAMSFLGAAQTGDLALVEVRADEAGRFEFPAVPPHTDYELSAVGEGFAVTHRMGIEAVAGEDTEVRLVTHPGATITGRVLSRPAGSDAEAAEALERAAPLAGAQVGAVPRGLRHLKFVKQILEHCHGTTDDAGRYVLHNVPAGEIDVLAMAEEHVPGKGPLVRVGVGGEHLAPDFTLERGPKVRGRVLDSAGQPVAGVRVMWNVVDFRALQGEVTLAPLMAAGMREFEFPLSDVEGRFVAGAFPGRAPYQLRFYRPGFKEETFRWDPKQHGDEIEVTLSRGGAVEGTLVDAASGAPIPRFTITTSSRVERIADEPSRWNPFAGGREFEAEDGRFVLDSLEPGQVGLVFSAPGYIDAPRAALVRESETTAAGQVTLTLGATLVGRVVDLAGDPIAGAQVTTDSRIERTFKRLEGNRRAAESAAGVPDDMRRRRRRNDTPPLGFLRYFSSLGLAGDGVVISESDGAFELAGLEPGVHTLMAFHRDYVSATVGPLTFEAGERKEGVDVELAAGGALYGTVSDRHGRPVVGATVIAASPGMLGSGSSAGGVHQSHTDKQGGYELAHMEGGGYFLVMTRGDEALSPMSFLGTLNLGLVSVPDEGRRRHDIIDTSAGACHVHGFVRSDGEPVARGSLVAFNFEAEGLLGVDMKVANVEADGSYSFEGLAPGEYQVQYSGPGPDTKFTIDVDDVPELRLDIELPNASIRGRVVDSNGAPVAGAEVRLEPRDTFAAGGLIGAALQGESRVARKTSGADGEFTFQRLAGGRYRLSVAGPTRGELRGHYASPPPVLFELAHAERFHGLEVVLPVAVRIEGRVVDDAGAPIASGVVLARPVKEPRARPETADVQGDGAFVLGGLSPGVWNVSARAEGYAPATRAALLIDPEGLPEPLELVLERGLEVTVRVVTPSGLPVEGAVATLVALDGVPETSSDPGRFFQSFFRGEATTDGNGELRVGTFGSGPHQLTVRKGFSETKRTIELPRGGGAHVETAELP